MVHAGCRNPVLGQHWMGDGEWGGVQRVRVRKPRSAIFKFLFGRVGSHEHHCFIERRPAREPYGARLLPSTASVCKEGPPRRGCQQRGRYSPVVARQPPRRSGPMLRRRCVSRSQVGPMISRLAPQHAPRDTASLTCSNICSALCIGDNEKQSRQRGGHRPTCSVCPGPCPVVKNKCSVCSVNL